MSQTAEVKLPPGLRVSASILLSWPCVQYEDGPNDEGEMFTRPGRLADKMPNPYPNEQVWCVFYLAGCMAGHAVGARANLPCCILACF